MGESWHNSHHVDPTCARHSFGRGQLDPSARVIWAYERLGWAHQVDGLHPAQPLGSRTHRSADRWRASATAEVLLGCLADNGFNVRR